MKAIAVLLVSLALTAGVLTLLVVPGTHQSCRWFFTNGTDRAGYTEIPCGLSPREIFAYLRQHPDPRFAPFRESN